MSATNSFFTHPFVENDEPATTTHAERSLEPAPTRRQTIFRNVSPEEPYTRLPNALLRDAALSLDERGALAMILSYPANWDFSEEHFCRENRIGRDRCRRIVRDLEKAGYCRRHQERTADGKLGSAVYLFSAMRGDFGAVDGKPVDGLPLTRNPSTAQPSAVNPSTAQPSTRYPSVVRPPVGDDAWIDARLLAWVDDDEAAQAVFRAPEVAPLSASLAEALPDQFLRSMLADILDPALLTDAGLYALRTLVAATIVADNPTGGGTLVVESDMLISASKRVLDAIFSSVGAEGPLDSYAGPGIDLAYELCTWRFAVAYPPLPFNAQVKLPASEEDCASLLALAETVPSSDAPAEAKLAQISAAIMAAS